MDLLQAQKWAYIPEIPDGIDVARDLLIKYSKIAPTDIDAHLLRIRASAWELYRYPWIGRWKFLHLGDPKDPLHQQILFRLKVAPAREAVLDLGCGVGQVLRQFKDEGVQAKQLIGMDKDERLINIGYDLFRDRETLGAEFVIGDVFDRECPALRAIRGKVSIIYAGSFFHLFSWDQQVSIGQHLTELFKPGIKNALIYGRQVGTTGDASLPTTGDTSPYLHSLGSFQRLWDKIGKLTNTAWTVNVETSDLSEKPTAGVDQNACQLDFIIYQLS